MKGRKIFYRATDIVRMSHGPTRKLLSYLLERASPILHIAQLDWARFEVVPRFKTAFKLNANLNNAEDIFEFTHST